MPRAEPDPLERWTADRDLRALAAADPGTVTKAVTALAAEAEAAHPAIDEDHLLSVANALRNAGHGTLDGVLTRRLSERPDAARLDVTATLLRTLWRGGGPDPQAVEALRAARAAAPSDESADAAALLALATALEAGLPEPLREAVRGDLAAAARQPRRHPAVGPVIERALRGG